GEIHPGRKLVDGAWSLPDLVTLVDYDPAWPDQFARERELIEAALGEGAAQIEHFGGTAVPGICAKPTLDILLRVPDVACAESLVAELELLGYHFVPGAAAMFPDRLFFRRGNPGASTHHLHLVELSGALWTRSLLLRDFLRSSPEASARFCRVKRE